MNCQKYNIAFCCPHGPTKNIFEEFLAVRMALQNIFAERFLAVRMALQNTFLKGF